MAEAILGGNAARDKSSFSSFNIPAEQHAPKLPGLVEHPLLSADVQAIILGLAREQRCVALRDIMAALPHHPAPVGATLALVEAGILHISPGVIEPDSELTIAPSIAAPEPDPGETPLPAALSGSEPLSSGITHIPANDLQPVICMVRGDERSALRKEALLQRTGFYFGGWAATGYIGTGKNVAQRASSNQKLRGSDPAHRIICITEAHNRLTLPQALVAERLFSQMVAQGGEHTPMNDVPHGAPIDPEEYDQVRLFVARAALALRRAGILFNRLPAAALLLPPAEPATSAPLNSDAQIYAITVPGLRAHLAEQDGEYWLLRGSEVRAEVKPSAYGPAMMARAELLHSGGLVRTGKVLSCTRDLVFKSAWAAGHFVVGQKPRSNLWRPLSASPAPDQPRP